MKLTDAGESILNVSAFKIESNIYIYYYGEWYDKYEFDGKKTSLRIIR